MEGIPIRYVHSDAYKCCFLCGEITVVHCRKQSQMLFSPTSTLHLPQFLTHTLHICSGEIHSDWREVIAQGIADKNLPVVLLSPNTSHEDSDDCGAIILGMQVRKTKKTVFPLDVIIDHSQSFDHLGATNLTVQFQPLTMFAPCYAMLCF